MRVPRPIAVAALTVITVGSISHAVLPGSQDHTNPASAQKEYAREYAANHRRELEQLQRKAAAEADAIAADDLRAAERRAAEQEAGAIVRGVLKKP